MGCLHACMPSAGFPTPLPLPAAESVYRTASLALTDFSVPPYLAIAEGAKPGCFRYFWITDSCPAAVDVAKREPFEVLSLAAPIAAALQI